jgi:tRNA-modifying protein YgfZ
MLAVDYDRLGVQQWLARLGAQALEDAYGIQGVFGDKHAGESAPLDSGKQSIGQIFPLSDLGLIQITGAEAAKFLHSQLTNDVENLQDSQWRWYAYCNAKGRMQLSAAGFKRGETISLIASRPLAAPLAKRLGMFVLRAKAKVMEASAQYEVYGLQGDLAPLLSSLGANAERPEPGTSMSIQWAGETIELLALEPFKTQAASAPAASASQSTIVPRFLMVAKSDSALWNQALASGLEAANSAYWRFSEVVSASARIVPATYELFVPQMLNFESIGGVDFKKGCYPGQEVVARSQYLGKLKRRMFLATLPDQSVHEPAPAQDVWANEASEGQEPCGQVVLTAALPGGPVQVLFEAQTGAVDQGQVGVRDSQGHWHALSVQPLPYALLDI